MEFTWQHDSGDSLTRAQASDAQRRPDEARRLYRAVLSEQPDNHTALTQLALLEYRHRAFDAAIELLRQADVVKSDDFDTLFSLGISYRAAGRPAESIPCFKKSIQLRPHDLQSYLNLASAYKDATQAESAVETLERANTLKLLDAEAWCHYARLLEHRAERQTSEFEDAIQAYRTSIRMDASNPEPAGRLGLLLEKINRIDEAEQTALEALVRTPNYPWLRLVLAKCKFRQRRYEEGIEHLSDVDLQACPPQLQMLICSELGVLYDKVGAHDRAFEFLSLSNQQARTTWDNYSGETETYIDKVEGLLRKVGQLKRPAPPIYIDDGYADPVFLIGFPRSGTTLLDQILDSHTGIHTLEEIPIFDLLLGKSNKLDGRYPLAMDQLSSDEIAELRQTYFKEVSRHVDYRQDALFIDKLPLNTWNTLLINRMFPKARFILAIRHPCDVCLSCFMQSFNFTTAMASFYSLESAVRLYDSVMQLWLHFEQILDLNYHMVRYEDVVTDLETETRRLIGFLGLEWDENMLHFDRHARNRLSISTPSYRQVRQPIYQSSVYRWKYYRRYFEPLVTALQPHIDRFGYGDIK